MINLEPQNIFHAGIVSESEFQSQTEKLPRFLSQIKARKQGFYEVIYDESVIAKIREFSKKTEGRYDDIVVCGIGGSALGAITVRDALADPCRLPRLHVLDNVDPDFIWKTENALKLSRTLFLVISKSGGTAETMSQYWYFRRKVEVAGLAAHEHFVFITGEESQLRHIGEKEPIPIFDVPENVGGRFSVLTNVGLLPSALIGLDIKALTRGGQKIAEKFLSPDPQTNQCFQLAVFQYLCFEQGLDLQVLMPYASGLKSFADWFKQLLAESTGKRNLQNKNVGITPISALGVTDQHSLLQLFSEGPNNKLFLFLQVKKFQHQLLISEEKNTQAPELFSGKTFQDLLQAEFQGTRDALTEAHRPNLTIQIPEITAENLGALLVLFEGATAFLGEFLQINAFNQPGVERSKVLAKKYLKERSTS